jgi:hypothetical protein
MRTEEKAAGRFATPIKKEDRKRPQPLSHASDIFQEG